MTWRLLLATLTAVALTAACYVPSAAVAPTPTAAARATETAPPSAIPTPGLVAPADVPTAAPVGGPIADGFRIQIPRLLIDLPIAEGDLVRDTIDQRTPEGTAFHLPGTASPGEGGNTYLYAHARTHMFLSLWNARLGDEVIIRTPGGGLVSYIVRDILPRVAANDVSPTLPTATERLTLQTSTGPTPDDPRFVVVALPR